MMTYVPELGILGVPYLIISDAHVEAVAGGEIGKEIENLKDLHDILTVGKEMQAYEHELFLKDEISRAIGVDIVSMKEEYARVDILTSKFPIASRKPTRYLCA